MMFKKVKNYIGDVNKSRDYILNLQKYESKTKLIERECPICSSKEYKFKFKTHITTFLKCSGCNLLYSKYVLKDINGFYKENKYYDKHWKAYYKSLIKEGYNKREPLINDVLKYTKKRGRLLDFGCGFGENLSILKNYFRSVEGIELNKFTAKKGAKLFNIKIHNKDIYDLKLKESSYDCIILSQVIEHLEDFKVFNRLRKLLKKDGIIYLSCPYSNSISMRLFKKNHTHLCSMVHLNIFGFKSFKSFANKYNLKIINIETDNTIDISLTDILNISSKIFIHRFNKVIGLNIISVVILKLMNKIFKKTNILKKVKEGSYINCILKKDDKKNRNQ